jgi:hypothetical protein
VDRIEWRLLQGHKSSGRQRAAEYRLRDSPSVTGPESFGPEPFHLRRRIEPRFSE